MAVLVTHRKLMIVFKNNFLLRQKQGIVQTFLAAENIS
jgi:hypothetical protein